MFIERWPSTVGYSEALGKSLKNLLGHTWIRFIKIVVVINKGRSDILKDYWSLRSDQHSNRSTPTSRSSIPFRIDCNIGGQHYGIAS